MTADEIGEPPVNTSEHHGQLAATFFARLQNEARPYAPGIAGQRIDVSGSDAADASLIRLCKDFIGLEVLEASFYRGGSAFIEDDDALMKAIEPIAARRAHLVSAMARSRASTVQGHAARAMAAVAYEGPMYRSHYASEGFDGVILAALLRDLIGNAS